MLKETDSRTTVAFLGGGRIGAPLAARLIKAGFDVRVWHRNAQLTNPLVDIGAIATDSPAQAAANADVLVTLLPDGLATQFVMTGDEGALKTLRSGAVWLQMSSVGVEWVSQLSDLVSPSDVVFVDAPITGSVRLAEAGSLLVLVGGPEHVRDQVAPILEAMSRNTVWLGDQGAGSKAKNTLDKWFDGLVKSFAETMRFSKDIGLDPQLIVGLLDDTPMGSPDPIAKARQVLAGEFGTNGAQEYASDIAELESLTERQWDVLSRLSRGQRVPTIAAELFISQSTVRSYLSEIFKILNVHSQAELLALLMTQDSSTSKIDDSPSA
ncbi:MAG TPA: NAD(P)-binding domain-containing protein [Acidimicrobiales bacterium]